MKKLPIRLFKKPFSTGDAVANGISKASLTRMVKAGVLERLSRGVYSISNVEGSGGSEYSEQEKQYFMATIRCGKPSAICLLSALEHYNLTGEIARQVWVLVPAPKRVVSKDLKLIRSRDPQWDIGIHKTRYYWMTTLERTLVDCLLYKRLIGHQVALAALKQALVQKKVKLGQVYDVAKAMGVAHRILPVIEAFGA